MVSLLQAKASTDNLKLDKALWNYQNNFLGFALRIGLVVLILLAIQLLFDVC